MKGAIFHNRYEILDVLGAGGTAICYKARDIVLNRPVTLKILREQYANDDQFVRRFKHEAQAVACLSHPNIVSIYDVVFDSDSHYLVMEYVEGCTLKQYLDQKGKLPINEVLYIMHQLMDALEHAHQHNVIHRDIKPHNILLDANMNVKVTDFGIAVAISDITQTYTKDIMGSVHYMSPEQVRGVAVTKSSDIYAAGVVMYEMLTGTLPFGGENAIGVAMQHVQGDITPPHKINPEIPVELSYVVMKALRKEPVMRFATAKEMQAALINPSLSMDNNGGQVNSFAANTDMNTKTMDHVMTSVNEIEDEYKQEQPKKRGLSSFIFDEIEVDENGNEIDNTPKTTKKNVSPKKSAKNNTGKGKIAMIIAAILLFAIGAFAVSSIIGGGEEVEVPDVVGMDLKEAIEKLEEKEFDYTVEYKTADEIDTDEDFKEGEVMEQSIEPGTMVKSGKTVKLTVCSGEGPVEVPGVIGMEAQKAKALLEEVGLVVSVEEKENDSEEPGIVFEQSLDKGTEAQVGDSITILVSKQKKVTVPNLEGLSLEEAKAKLKAEGLSVGNVTQKNSDSYSPNQVMSQNVSPGSEVEKGSKVDLVVSSGPKLETRTIGVNAGSYIPDDGSAHSVTILVSDEAGKAQDYTKSNCMYGDSVDKDFTVSGQATVKIKIDGSVVDVWEE